RDRGAARDRLPTSVVPASAQDAAGLDDGVADLAREPVRPALDLAAEDEAAADPRPDPDVEEVLDPAPSAGQELSDRRGVAVVVDRRWQAETGELRGQVDVAPRDVRREPHRPRAAFHEPSGADTDRDAARIEYLRGHVPHRLEHTRHVGGR